MSLLGNITSKLMRKEIETLLRVSPRWRLNSKGCAIDWRTGDVYYLVLSIRQSPKRPGNSDVTFEVAMKQGHFRSKATAKAYDLLPGLAVAFITAERVYTGEVGLDRRTGNLLTVFTRIDTEIALQGRFELASLSTS